ncbi:MAG: hypothetical protein QNJ22_05130 [Desulfosarcinaceae bacterium]|nr:hypothetical protein [Desulfosarcinaceae bacterium]
MRSALGQLGFVLLFLSSVAALQVAYWLERRIIGRLRTLAPDHWRRFTYFFGARLHRGRLKRRIALGGLRDETVVTLLRNQGRANAIAVGAFLGAMLMLALDRFGR